jgi:hypothetical protein
MISGLVGDRPRARPDRRPSCQIRRFPTPFCGGEYSGFGTRVKIVGQSKCPTTKVVISTGGVGLGGDEAWGIFRHVPVTSAWVRRRIRTSGPSDRTGETHQERSSGHQRGLVMGESVTKTLPVTIALGPIRRCRTPRSRREGHALRIGQLPVRCAGGASPRHEGPRVGELLDAVVAAVRQVDVAAAVHRDVTGDTRTSDR